MKKLRFGRHALYSAVAVATLAGCAGQQPPIDGAGAAPQNAATTNGPLLYVADVRHSGDRTYSVVSILSLRSGKLLTSFNGYYYVSGLCSDRSGNVWMPNLRHGYWRVDEFARGGTVPIQVLPAPHRWLSLAGCAVDPRSGDLAVMGANIDGAPYALIWSGARSGNPAEHPVPFEPLNAAYDDAENLFISGWEGGSDFFFEFGELAKDSGGAVTQIKLDKETGIPGAVQWDGTYVVVETSNPHRHLPLLYRVEVSGSKGNVVGIVQPQELYDSLFGPAYFVLHGGSVISTAGRHGKSLWAWPYPAGGKPTQSIAKYPHVTGLTISLPH